ncbi:alpha/beta hydrolase [Candidatus Babeliales bacterium]|nr:alpha/beta hydrolase [Candidatus Babeliales bacterium]MBP9844018.1 alpha/beta hydrolase [Candidatus Babeliales bacterium]
MIKKIDFFLLIHITLCVVGLQASSPLVEIQGLYNLPAIKEQIKNIQFEEIIFDAFVDQSKTSMHTRRAILVRKNNAIGTVVVCHGYLGCKRDSIALKHLFPLYNVLAFDFRAHGDDRDGQFSTIGRDEAFDVIGAVSVVKSDPAMKDKPVIVYGFSMGAVSAIQAQAMEPGLFDAMILDCPYDSTDEAMRRGLEEKMKWNIFGRQFTIPGKEFILYHMYDDASRMLTDILFRIITQLDSKKVITKFVKVMPIESVKKITVPCFFIHCENDKKVPIHAVEALYNNKEQGLKRLWITPGKGHFGSYQHNPELYWYKVNKFLMKLHQQDASSRVQAKVCDHRTRVTISTAQLINNKRDVA